MPHSYHTKTPDQNYFGLAFFCFRAKVSGVSGQWTCCVTMTDIQYMGVVGSGAHICVWAHAPSIKIPMTIKEDNHVPSYYPITELGIDPKTVARKAELTPIMGTLLFHDPVYAKEVSEARAISASWSIAALRLKAWRRRRAAIQAWMQAG